MYQILYNSCDYHYSSKFTKIFQVKKNSNEEYSVLYQIDFSIDFFCIYIKNDMIQIDFFYKKEKNKKETILNYYNILLNNKEVQEYKEYISEINLYLYYNTLDNDLFSVIKYDKCNFFESNQYYVLSIFANKNDFYTKIDHNISHKFLFSDFLQRNDLTDLETKFIISYYHRIEKKEEINNNIIKNNRDNYFKEFMAMDSFNLKMTQNEKQNLSFEHLKIVDGSIDPNKDLNELVGLQNIKEELEKLNAKIRYYQIREMRNIFSSENDNLHMCFYGNPGTGKTTVARILTGMLYQMGYITKNKCIEINANELKGSKIGQTSIKTKILLRNAKNKVLFIDEAYSLNDNQDGFGQEAIDTIVKEMEDNKNDLIIIFAGYKKEMQKFISSNEGLKSRINRYLEFENYNMIELCKIFVLFLDKKQLKITTEALAKCILFFRKMLFYDNFSNARFIRNLVEEIEEIHAINTENNDSMLHTVTLDDTPDSIFQNLILQNKGDNNV